MTFRVRAAQYEGYYTPKSERGGIETDSGTARGLEGAPRRVREQPLHPSRLRQGVRGRCNRGQSADRSAHAPQRRRHWTVYKQPRFAFDPETGRVDRRRLRGHDRRGLSGGARESGGLRGGRSRRGVRRCQRPPSRAVHRESRRAGIRRGVPPRLHRRPLRGGLLGAHPRGRRPRGAGGGRFAGGRAPGSRRQRPAARARARTAHPPGRSEAHRRTGALRGLHAHLVQRRSPST